MPETESSLPPEHAELKIKRPVGETVPRKRAAKSAPAARPAAPTRLRPERDAGAGFFRVVLWIALLGWLFFLAFKLLDPLPFLFPDEDDTAAYGWWRVDSDAVEQEAVAPRTAPAETAEDPELHALKLKVVESLLAGRFSDAIDAIQRQKQTPDIYPYQAELGELDAFVRAVTRVNQTVADAIRDKIDEEIVIRLKDRRLSIIPRASAGDRINALLIPSRADQPRSSLTFAVSDLDPIERAHWIGQADTPYKCTMKLLLHMQAGDHDGARVFAPSCGILAAAFDAKMKASAGGAVGP